MTSKVLEALHVLGENAHPSEACAVLLGEGTKITAYMEAANVHPTPQTLFEIDPQTLVDAYRAERCGGLQVLGFFHSHPKGSAVPSKADQRLSARDGKIWAVLGEGEIRFWQDSKQGFEELSYIVAAD